jgi:tRNA A-37 threonylcarbamoyl transferase component Bud32/tetratricopeptide (TPR) repeat protein
MKACPTCGTGYSDTVAFCSRDGTELLDVELWSEGKIIRGRYRILGKIGQGGMGTVYKAQHVAFDEPRALKVMSLEHVRDELFARRFKQEAVLARKLRHPNTVHVEDIDESEDGRPFIVMEFIEGRNLKELIQDAGPLKAKRVCSVAKQVAAALDEAHRLGIVHRDIKPANIVLVRSPRGEQVKVLDFGIAKLKEEHAGGTLGMTLTGTGVVIGTPQYMSPEQAAGRRGNELDGRSDLYSLGIVMYQMLTGELPFKGDTSMEILLARIQTPPKPITQVRLDLQIPQPLARLVMACLEKQPELRPATGQSLVEELDIIENEIAKEDAEQERVREKAEAERRAAAQAEAQRLAWVRVEQERLALEKAARESRAREKAEAERRGAEKAEAARLERARAAQERLASEKAERLARVQAGQDRLAREAAAIESAGNEQQVTPASSFQDSNWRAWTLVVIFIFVALLGGGFWLFPWINQPRLVLVLKPTAPPNPPSIPIPPPAPPTPVPTTPKPPVDPKAIADIIRKGDSYRDQGQYAKAIIEFELGLRLDPRDKELRRKLEKARDAEAAERRIGLPQN